MADPMRNQGKLGFTNSPLAEVHDHWGQSQSPRSLSGLSAGLFAFWAAFLAFFFSLFFCFFKVQDRPTLKLVTQFSPFVRRQQSGVKYEVGQIVWMDQHRHPLQAIDPILRGQVPMRFTDELDRYVTWHYIDD